MKKNKLGLMILLSLLIVACGAEKPKQVIIPEAQLDALDKAKNLQNDLEVLQQKQQEQLKAQGL